MNDVAQDFLRKEVKLHASGTGTIRIFELYQGRTQKFFQGNEVVRDISESTELFAEEVLMEEEESRDDERIVQVYHFNKDPQRAHGVPFRFILRAVRPHVLLSLVSSAADTNRSAERTLLRDEETITGANRYERQGPCKDEVCRRATVNLHEARSRSRQ